MTLLASLTSVLSYQAGRPRQKGLAEVQRPDRLPRQSWQEAVAEVGSGFPQETCLARGPRQTRQIAAKHAPLSRQPPPPLRGGCDRVGTNRSWSYGSFNNLRPGRALLSPCAQGEGVGARASEDMGGDALTSQQGRA